MRVVALAACILAHSVRVDQQCLEACTKEGTSCSRARFPFPGDVRMAVSDRAYCSHVLRYFFGLYVTYHTPTYSVDNCFCQNCDKSTNGTVFECEHAFSTETASSSTTTAAPGSSSAASASETTSSSATTAAPGSNSAASASETSSTSVHYLWLLLLAVVILVFIVTIAIRYRRFTGQNDNKENVENSQMGATDQSGEDKADIESPQVEANDRKEDEKDEVEHL
eukprot:GEMP01030452.1.p1 GENE.GEMP01030452.1~~GEMP01030452.1.p1  ORF type:complete len:224 (+),score=45.82 GEMP01030452.1:108-779(+)